MNVAFNAAQQNGVCHQQTCLTAALVGADPATGKYAEQCVKGPVPGGRVYVVPFSQVVPAAAGGPPVVPGAAELEIRPRTPGVPVAMFLGDAVSASLRITGMFGPDGKRIGIQPARNSDFVQSWPLLGFQDQDIVTGGLQNLPGDIGRITADQGLRITVENDDTLDLQVLRGELHLWVPPANGEFGDAAKYGCFSECVKNIVGMYYIEDGKCAAGNVPGLYPIPFEATIADSTVTDIVLAAAPSQGIVPVAMKLDDALVQRTAGVTPGLEILSIEGPDGQPIGLLGDDISDDWALETFQNMEKLKAQLSSLPPNVGLMTPSRPLTLSVIQDTGGDLIVRGYLYAWLPREVKPDDMTSSAA